MTEVCVTCHLPIDPTHIRYLDPEHGQFHLLCEPPHMSNDFRRYEFCRSQICGHLKTVHDESGCHGQRMTGGEWDGPDTCPCTEFVESAPSGPLATPQDQGESVVDAGTEDRPEVCLCGHKSSQHVIGILVGRSGCYMCDCNEWRPSDDVGKENDGLQSAPGRTEGVARSDSPGGADTRGGVDSGDAPEGLGRGDYPTIDPPTDDEMQAMVNYWQQPTGMDQAPPGMVSLALYQVQLLVATIRSLREVPTATDGLKPIAAVRAAIVNTLDPYYSTGGTSGRFRALWLTPSEVADKLTPVLSGSIDREDVLFLLDLAEQGLRSELANGSLCSCQGKSLELPNGYRCWGHLWMDRCAEIREAVPSAGTEEATRLRNVLRDIRTAIAQDPAMPTKTETTIFNLVEDALYPSNTTEGK